jgi:uncharacterized membrane protein YccC
MIGIQDKGDSYPQRTRAMLLGLGVTTGVALIAAVASGNPWLELLAAAPVALFSGLAPAWGPRFGRAGSAGIKIFPILSAVALTVPEAFLSTAAYVVGGCLQILVVLVAWLVRGGADTREPLAVAWRAVGHAGTGRATRLQLVAMRTAVDRAGQLASALPSGPPRTQVVTRLAGDVRAVEASVIRSEYRDDDVRDTLPAPYREAVSAACLAVARAIRTRTAVAAAHNAIGQVTGHIRGNRGTAGQVDRSRIEHALTDAAAAVSTLHRPETKAGQWDRPVGAPLFTGRPDLSLSAPVVQEAIRLCVMFTLATAVGLASGSVHGYWVAMTVAVVSMPGYATALGRTLSRLAGTLLAVGVIALIGLVAGPLPLGVLAGLTALSAFVYYLTLTANYAIATFGISGFVLLLATMLGQPLEQSALARTLATLAGAVIIVVGTLIHPRRSAPRLGAALADYADALAAYLVIAADDTAAEVDLEAAARRCRDLHSAVDVTLDEAWAEPAGRGLDPHVGHQVLRHLVEVALYGTDMSDGVIERSPGDAAATASSLDALSRRLRLLSSDGRPVARRAVGPGPAVGFPATEAAQAALDLLVTGSGSAPVSPPDG